MSAFFFVMTMGSGKSCSVNALEWFQPFSALATYFSGKPGGRWQSAQVAAV